jgi:hypothetical protein
VGADTKGLKMRALLTFLLLVLLGPWHIAAADQDAARAREVLAANAYPIDLSGGVLKGQAAAFLTAATQDAQFVLAGENHHDHFTPLFDLALFRLLHASHGFDHVVVEQDPLAIEAMLQPGLRGNAAAMGASLRDFRSVLGFASDEDLQFLAGVAAAEPALPDQIWGIEQTQSPVLALDILVKLAPDAHIRADAARLRDAAGADRSRVGFITFMEADPATLPRLRALQAEFHAEAGSRADTVLTALVKSAEIYSYYRRSAAGEKVGLYNNTVREQWLKEGFIRKTRAAQPDGGLKALFKFGANHMVGGLNRVGSMSLGNFLHEFAIWNGKTAFGIEIVTFGSYTDPADVAYLKPVLPEGRSTPVLIDLRALRPYYKGMAATLAPEERAALRAELFGYEAIAFFPASRKASWAMTGFAPP